MREIKFRAWDKKTETMAEFLTPFIAEGGYLYFSKMQNGASEKWEDGTGIVNESIILMQYTGLKDKNGKEIWEGDIVKYKFIYGFDAYDYRNEYKPNLPSDNLSEEIKEVKFINGEFSPREDGENCYDGYYSWRTFDFEIIGNIYENPELLTT